jgi:hypothetical protein
MEPALFDALARRFAHPATRRSIFGALLGSLAFLAGRRPATAQIEPPYGIPLGGACSVSTECSQFQGCYDFGPIICADNGIAEDGPLNCCLGAGGLCGADAHCCEALLCLDTGGDGRGAGTCQPGDGPKPTVRCNTPVASGAGGESFANADVLHRPSLRPATSATSAECR